MIDLEDPNDPLARIEAQNAALRALIEQVESELEIASTTTEEGFRRLGEQFGGIEKQSEFIHDWYKRTYREVRTELRSLDTGMVELNQRMNRMDKRMDRIDQRFDGIDAWCDSVDSRFDGIDTWRDSVDSRFNSVDSRFDEIDTWRTEVNGKLDAILAAVGGEERGSS